ncbi:hypothetical protein U3A55_11295 [Salarchaeum sp. III]|uniref:hypothetical protein n=1 Tax=Salarchaeum sp. III TaxID=3107927 RepID=UPI002EDA63D9
MSRSEKVWVIAAAVLLIATTSGCMVNSGSNETIAVTNEMTTDANVTVSVVSGNETIQTKTYTLEPGEERAFTPEYSQNRTVVVRVGSRSDAYDWMGGRLDITVQSGDIEFFASAP